jgi:uncharacterized phage infection (PIP) family protein YhgE
MLDPNEKLIRTAVIWWESMRPLSWTIEQHLDDPTINAGPTVWDCEMATAVAEYVKSTQPNQPQPTATDKMNTNQTTNQQQTSSPLVDTPSDAPTPETDAQEQSFWQAFESSPEFLNVYISTEQMDPVFDFARRLERSRDEAQAGYNTYGAKCKELQQQLAAAQAELSDIATERNQAKVARIERDAAQARADKQLTDITALRCQLSAANERTYSAQKKAEGLREALEKMLYLCEHDLGIDEENPYIELAHAALAKEGQR